MMADPRKLNPGSKSARKAGCRCDVADNNGGKGVGPGRQKLFWVSEKCKVHGELASVIRGWREKEAQDGKD